MISENEGFIDNSISYVVAAMVAGAFISSAPVVVLVDCFSASGSSMFAKYCGNLLFLSVLFPCVIFGVPAFVLSALYLGNHFYRHIMPNCGNTRKISTLLAVKLVLTAVLFAALSYYYETRIYGFSPVVARLYLFPFVTYSAVLFAFVFAHWIATNFYPNTTVEEVEYEQV